VQRINWVLIDPINGGARCRDCTHSEPLSDQAWQMELDLERSS